MSEQEVRKFLVAFHFWVDSGHGTANVDAANVGSVTLETIRKWEADLREKMGARRVVIINYQELEA